MVDDRTFAYLRLNLASGVGPILFARLLESFGHEPEAIFAASPARLKRVERVGDKVAAALRDPATADLARREAEEAAERGIAVVTLDDDRYPPRLRHIPDPPPVLYVIGRLAGERDNLSLGVVGSRQTSYYGRDQARRFGGLLARAGFVVVSGFARGVDTDAHQGALHAGGRTIAVIGSGLCDIYPPENRELVDDVVAHGAVISEFPLHTAPQAGNFPRRNRIIAGMTLGSLVVEAGLKSGAMITARQASDFGREVFAIPGRIDDERTRGCHYLIKQGAKLVEDVADIIEELGDIAASVNVEPAGRPGIRSASDAAAPTAADDEPTTPLEPILADLSGDATLVLNQLSKEPTGIDVLAARCHLPAHRVTAALTILELKGLVRQLAGRHYTRLR